MPRTLVVLTGAGMSAESGVPTFRDSGGLWENHDVMEVASPEGWQANPSLVQRFYNERRRQMKTVQPNAGHHALAAMEVFFDVHIITQNIDNLHERAGSSKVVHLHGEIFKRRSAGNPDLLEDWDGDIEDGALASDGHPWRPDVVWFGEAVPRMGDALDLTKTADLFLVVGTSLAVYPAASLIGFTPPHAQRLVMDPMVAEIGERVPELAMASLSDGSPGIELRAETAAVGLPRLLEEWRAAHG